MADDPHPNVTRRALLAGLGAAGGAGLLATGFAETPAQAQEAGSGVPDGGTKVAPAGLTPIGSGLDPGESYLYASMFDFVPERGERTLGPSGVYNLTQAARLWATFDLPRGAVLSEVEWYVRNSTAGNVVGLGRIWEAGSGVVDVTAFDTTIPPGGSVVRARKGIVPETSNGPYPAGTKLLLGITTPTNGSVQVNGARVGFRPGGTLTTLLPEPVRVYDSRAAGGTITPNQTRRVQLAAHLPVGAVAALFNLSVTDTVGVGTLRAAAAGSVPTATAVQWARSGSRVTTFVSCRVSGSRQVDLKSVSSSGPTHVLVDLIGYLS